MPSLPEEMYCSEQICIPPSFPYLLRQYAKAAIRTQPTDLLKWSTAYFRCLSLNVPPPVKPRLEYPIPRDFNGITPGWLKTLLYQLQNNLTVPFKILWDRWIGACLQHQTLIQLLCLGGFEDPHAIPWFRFIAICAGTLTDDLTHTMILICEILTEEPEGGSAMIPLETFLDLYQFLAKIDASNGQSMRNYFFRDSLLSLWREKVEKEEEKQVEQEESVIEPEESIVTKSSSESLFEVKSEEVEKVVSCPSLPEDDHYSIAGNDSKKAGEYLLKQESQQTVEEEGELLEEMQKPAGDEPAAIKDELKEGEEQKPVEESEKHEDEPDETKGDLEQHDDVSVKEKGEEEPGSVLEEDVKLAEPITEPSEAKDATKEAPAETGEDTQQEVQEYESVETILDQPVRDVENIFEDDKHLQEDLERLRALQQELVGETDDEVEKFKCRLIEEMPLTDSQEKAIKHFGQGPAVSSGENLKLGKSLTGEGVKSGEVSSEDLVQPTQTEPERPYDDIYVDTVRGIGGMVPEDLIKAVVVYMKNCAKQQHGMVMPRNIRHYSCPPLEESEY